MRVRLPPVTPIIKEKEMDDNEVEKIVIQNIEAATLIYSVIAYTNSGDSDEEFLKKIKEWSAKSASNLIKSLEKGGYAIVPKEPAFDSLLN